MVWLLLGFFFVVFCQEEVELGEIECSFLLRRRLNRSPNSSCDASPSETPLERPDFSFFFLQMCLHDAVLGEALLANGLFEQVPDPAPPHSRANFPFRFQLTELEAPPSRQNDV